MHDHWHERQKRKAGRWMRLSSLEGLRLRGDVCGDDAAMDPAAERDAAVSLSVHAKRVQPHHAYNRRKQYERDQDEREAGLQDRGPGQTCI